MSVFEKDMKKFGFGLMRLPRKEATGNIDLEHTAQMVDAFLEAGFTYFDTAWSYPDSEEAIRETLVKRYPRESYKLATKLAAWVKCETREDALKQFEDSLERAGVEYFDYYLLHNLGEQRTRFFDEFGLWDWVMEQKEKGLIKHLGFSFHSTPEELEEILTAHPEMEFVQLQLNYGDWENPMVQSRGIYEVARKFDMPIIVMEPVKGGMLATPPPTVEKIFKEADPERSCAEWAIKFAADLDGVAAVLSGMSSLEQMEENIRFMKDFDGLTDEERPVIEKAMEEIAKVPIIPCTSCNYCAKVCPMEIGISGEFTAMNYLTLYNNMAKAKNSEDWLVDMHGLKFAKDCIKCGKCEEVCPQHIEIRKELEKVDKALG